MQTMTPITQRLTLPQLLSPLTLEQTRNLLQRMVDERPELIEMIDRYASEGIQPKISSTLNLEQNITVDPMFFKREVQSILLNAVEEWEDGRDDDDIALEMNSLIKDALVLAQQGDGASALLVLLGITEGAVENWHEIDNFCGLTPLDLDVDFDRAWTEVLLRNDLTEDQAQEWQECLASWQTLNSFSMALEALRQGWTYPPLVQVLQGDPSARSIWMGEPPTWAGDLAQIRLAILEQDDRYEEYLRLAKVEGQTQKYLTMLGKLGRVDQAMAAAQTQMKTLAEAKALAEVLREQNQLNQALQIALQGLQLESEYVFRAFDFALWTSELAESLGQTREALNARISAFKFRPAFEDYQKIQQMAGADWPNVQPSLIQHLRNTDDWGCRKAQVDVFLHEGLWEDAIVVASKSSNPHDTLTLRVMDKVIATHSQWVIGHACPYAESIINSGKAKYYGQAVEWLKLVKQAYGAMGKRDDWSQYYQELVSQHRRRRKLMELIKENRLDL